MDSDRHSTPTSTPEEEFLDIDGVSEENYAILSDRSSLRMDDAFSTKREVKEEAIFNNQPQSATPVERASDSNQHIDSAIPIASNSSLHLHSNDKLDIKAVTSGNIFFDQARRKSLPRQRYDGQMQIRSKLCQTDWSWEDDIKLLAKYSESSFYCDLLSEMNEAEMKEGLTRDLGRASNKSSFRGTQTRTGSAAGDDDLMLTCWEKEIGSDMQSSGEGRLTPFFKTISSVGPPQILQYNKESVFPNTVCPSTLKKQTVTSYGTLDEELQNYIFQLDQAARRAIMAGESKEESNTICQFCGKEATVNPYCCNAYREHLEILRKSELDGYLTGKSSLDFKSQLLYGHKKTRKGGYSTEGGSHLRSAKKKNQSGLPHSLKQAKPSQEKRAIQPKSSKEKQTGLPTKDKGQGLLKAANDDGSSRLAPLMVKDVVPRSQHLAPSRNLIGLNTSLYQQGGGKQQKTISYQLSSKKCLDDGWTLSSSPSLARSELTEDYNDLIQISRLNGNNSLFVRTYDNGKIFAVIFSDGSGTIFHPNGKVAISAVQIDEGLYTYIIQDDSDESNIRAIFQPDGHACVYFPDGRLRISLTPSGGLEIGRHGAKKRKWLWYDMYDQQQRAPLQPITIGVTPECGIRIMSQGNITVTYNNDCRNIRLHVGTRLTLSNPQISQAALKDLYNQDEQFRKETKLCVATLINQISTVLEFPKSLKLDIPRPLHLLNSNRPKRFERSPVTT